MHLSVAAINAANAAALKQTPFLSGIVQPCEVPHGDASSLLVNDMDFELFLHPETGSIAGWIQRGEIDHAVYQVPGMPPNAFYVEPAELTSASGFTSFTSTINPNVPISDEAASAAGTPVVLRAATSGEGIRALRATKLRRAATSSSLVRLLKKADIIDDDGATNVTQAYVTLARRQVIDSFAVLERTGGSRAEPMYMQQLSPEYARHLLGGAIVYGFGEPNPRSQLAQASRKIWQGGKLLYPALAAALKEKGPVDFKAIKKAIKKAATNYYDAYNQWLRFVDLKDAEGQTPLPLLMALATAAEGRLLAGDEERMQIFVDYDNLFRMAEEEHDTFAAAYREYLMTILEEKAADDNF